MEEESDGGVAEVALPKTPVVVAHNGVGFGVVSDRIKLVAATGVDFGGIALDMEALVGNATEGFINLDDGWEFPERHFLIIAINSETLTILVLRNFLSGRICFISPVTR